MIKPTVGRVVWYHPMSNEGSPFARNDDQPHAAIIARVWSDTCVNLTVLDANGHTHSRTSVPLLQDDAPVPPHGYYAEWMPFQKGQAAKSDASEKASAVVPSSLSGDVKVGEDGALLAEGVTCEPRGFIASIGEPLSAAFSG